MTRATILMFFALRASAQDGYGDAAQPAAAISSGRKIFEIACAGCHGSRGEGERGPNLANGKLVRRASDAQLFSIVQKGVPGTEMPPFPLPPNQIRDVIAYTRSLSAPAAEAEVPGNSFRGREVFTGKGGCSQCHMIRGEGGYLGPDLSNAGASRSLKQLRDALLDPKSRSAKGYQGVTAITKTGERLEGIARNRTNYSLQLEDAAGNLHLLETGDLREVRLATSSIMPGDYDKRLTPAEIDDLLAYLAKQVVRPPGQRSRPETRTRRPL